jgi:hypothetical protein
MVYGTDMQNGKPYIEIKKARIARAGRQFYTASEMKERAAKFKDSGKGLYAEYRPPEVLIKNLSKFNYVPFINDHTTFDLTPDNWKQYAIGVVGGNAGVEVVNDEVYVTNDVVFYDRKAYEDYRNGKVELSARYDARFGLVDDEEACGYSSVLLDIPSVNHVALVSMARAGHEAKIIDGLGTGSGYGGFEMKMKSGFLSFLGIGKAKDDSFKFSTVLMDSLGKVKAGEATIEKEIPGVAGHFASLGDSEAKELLTGAVADCYKNVDAVLARKDEVGKRLDELYCKCQDAGNDAVKRILEGSGETGSEEAEKKKKEDGTAKTSDSAAIDELVTAAVEKAMSKINDDISASINDKVDAAMKNALGTETDKKDPAPSVTGAAASLNDSYTKEDASYLVRGVFGNR